MTLEIHRTAMTKNELIAQLDNVQTAPQHMSSEQILSEGTMIYQREDTVPSRSVLDDTDVVDLNHVKRIQTLMYQDDGRKILGQSSRLWVRPRFDEAGSIVYDIIDGFHRNYINKKLSIPTTDIIALFNISTELFYDLRIATTSDKAALKFARMADWMQKSFEETIFFQKGLTIKQIFSLALQGNSGKILKLTPEEVEQAKEWSKFKADLWGTSISTIYSNFRTIDLADPELVKIVRISAAGGGHKNSGILTLGRLLTIVESVPGNGDRLQTKLYEQHKIHNYRDTELEILCKTAALFRGYNSLIDHIMNNSQLIISSMADQNLNDNDLRAFVVDILPELPNANGNHERVFEPINPSKLNRSHEDSPTIEDLEDRVWGIDGTVFTSTFTKGNSGPKEEHETEEKVNKMTYEELQREVQDLRMALEKTNKQKDKKTNKGTEASEDKWWQTFHDLTSEERKLITMEREDKKSIYDIMTDTGLTRSQINKSINSGLRKYFNYQRQLLEDEQTKETGHYYD